MKTFTQHYIGGAFVESHGREVMDSINPSNGQVIAQVTLGDEEDARRAILAAKEAFRTFSKTTLEQRSQYLRRLHAAVAAKLTEHSAAMVEEYGGVAPFCAASSQRAAESFLLAEAAMKELPWSQRIGGAVVTLEPLGVVGLITPWNASSSFVCGKLASAIAAGCTAVIKPSELSPLQTAVLLECLHAAELPPGVWNVVTGRGEVVGAAITSSPDVAKISFTGSTLVGKTIARDGAATMKRVTLELGGKSPNVLLADADLKQSIPSALGLCFMNSGQACIAGTRLIVPEERLQEVKQEILKSIDSFKVGNPADKDTAIGPMVSKRQYERVQNYIRQGIQEGAELLVGGLGHPEGLEAGNFVKPTVFTKVQSDMTIACEEIFGPVLCVLTYKTEAEAIEIANDTSYGLAAYVSGKDRARLEHVASQLVAGRVGINGFKHEPQAPFGGFKQSGLGRELGTYGLQAYLEPKAVLS
jgi:aldehyde dehydrogenase (NAD+)